MDRPLPQQKLQLTRVTCYLPSLPASTTSLGVELAIGFELASPLLHRNHELVNFLWTCHFRELFFFFFLLWCQAALQSVLTLDRQIKGFTVSESQIPFSLDFSLCLRKFNARSLLYCALQHCSSSINVGRHFLWAVSISVLHSAWWMASRLMPRWPLALRVHLSSMRNLKASLGYSRPLHNAAPEYDLWGNFPPRATHIWLSEAYCLFRGSEAERISIIHVLGGDRNGKKWGKKNATWSAMTATKCTNW